MEDTDGVEKIVRRHPQEKKPGKGGGAGGVPPRDAPRGADEALQVQILFNLIIIINKLSLILLIFTHFLFYFNIIIYIYYI